MLPMSVHWRSAEDILASNVAYGRSHANIYKRYTFELKYSRDIGRAHGKIHKRYTFH